jgi:hypothetical protein
MILLINERAQSSSLADYGALSLYSYYLGLALPSRKNQRPSRAGIAAKACEPRPFKPQCLPFGTKEISMPFQLNNASFNVHLVPRPGFTNRGINGNHRCRHDQTSSGLGSAGKEGIARRDCPRPRVAVARAMMRNLKEATFAKLNSSWMDCRPLNSE